MLIKRKIDENRAIEIAKKKMPQAIHECVIQNFKKESKVGILSFIELSNPKVEEVVVDDEQYFEIIFMKGDLSWQELSSDYKEVDIYFDGEIEDDKLAKCLINKKSGKFKYIGECDLGPVNNY